MSCGYTLFDTTIGRCGIAWTTRGVLALRLPGATDHVTRRRLLDRSVDAVEGAPPNEVQHAIDGVVALLEGTHVDLTGIDLDLTDVRSFHRRVYELARSIPPGTTRTYGELARELGGVDWSRDVGQALAANPIAIVVPCHRVVAANGEPGGFSAHGGVETKVRMLSIEGALADPTPTLFDA
jgi:methylated-DNA-[protein]-cysteine S-methyltransferase